MPENSFAESPAQREISVPMQTTEKYPVVVNGALAAPYGIRLEDGSLLTVEQALKNGESYYSSNSYMAANGTLYTASLIQSTFDGTWTGSDADKRTTQEAAGLKKEKDGQLLVTTLFDKTQPADSDGGTWFYTNYCTVYYIVHQYLTDPNFKNSSLSKEDAIQVLQALENVYHGIPVVVAVSRPMEGGAGWLQRANKTEGRRAKVHAPR